jgi:ribosomal protein S6--L-glutamate ligase
MIGNRGGAIWFLTDRRYLAQRMPGAVCDWLRAQGCEVRLVLAEEAGAIEIAPGEATAPWDELQADDLVVVRSRDPYALALLQVAESLGARALDGWSAISRVRDKVRCTTALARAGIPIPPTFIAGQPRELERVPIACFPLILKPVLGDNARGVLVVPHPDGLAAVAWTEEHVLAQSYLDADGIDLKVYVAGDAIWAVRRPSPLLERTDAPVPAAVTPTLRALVDGCRAEFGLHLFGLDVLDLPAGPVVVDVNEFPNYTGIDEAPAEIGQLLIDAVDRAGVLVTT